MREAIWLLAALGTLGAFDTIWFHELRGKLVARPEMRPELRLHVIRDALYVIVFAALPFVQWHGGWAIALAAVLLAEFVVTMLDFVTEDRVRASIGGVMPGERVTHAVMGIVYGAMLAFLTPVLWAWFQLPTQLLHSPAPVPGWLRIGLVTAAVATLLHGLRDLAAVLALPGSSWPWTDAAADPPTHPAPR